MKFYVEVIAFETNKVVKQIECSHEQKAERVEMGVLRQMDLERFYTRVVPEGEQATDVQD